LHQISIILPMTTEELGKTLLQRRIFLNLKQEDVAELTGIGTKTIYLIESGKGNPSLSTLQKLAGILGMEVSVNVKDLENG